MRPTRGCNEAGHFVLSPKFRRRISSYAVLLRMGFVVSRLLRRRRDPFRDPLGYPRGGGLLPRLFTLIPPEAGRYLFCDTFRYHRLTPTVPSICSRHPARAHHLDRQCLSMMDLPVPALLNRRVEFGLSSPFPQSGIGAIA